MDTQLYPGKAQHKALSVFFQLTIYKIYILSRSTNKKTMALTVKMEALLS